MIRFVAGPFTVNIDSYQWGYRAGVLYLERVFGTTPVGTLFRSKIGDDTRSLVVTFAQSDTLLSQLRELGLYAARTATRVQFIPDTADLGTFRWIDWSPAIEFRHVIEGRIRVEIPIMEQV